MKTERIVALLVAFALLAGVLAARAEEGGVGHYAPGSFASFVDVLPVCRGALIGSAGSIRQAART